jgi:hypothetical protein
MHPELTPPGYNPCTRKLNLIRTFTTRFGAIITCGRETGMTVFLLRLGLT